MILPHVWHSPSTCPQFVMQVLLPCQPWRSRSKGDVLLQCSRLWISWFCFFFSWRAEALLTELAPLGFPDCGSCLPCPVLPQNAYYSSNNGIPSLQLDMWTLLLSNGTSQCLSCCWSETTAFFTNVDLVTWRKILLQLKFLSASPIRGMTSRPHRQKLLDTRLSS